MKKIRTFRTMKLKYIYDKAERGRDVYRAAVKKHCSIKYHVERAKSHAYCNFCKKSLLDIGKDK